MSEQVLEREAGLGLKDNIFVEFQEVAPAGTAGEHPPLPLEAQRYLNSRLKRTLDLFLVLLCAPVALVLVGLAAAATKLSSPGPVLFVQERLGRNRRPFRCYKLRTMVVGAEAAGPQWAQARDPRVTWVGRILRQTRLDELPQLYNVWRGEMSFVGPRPIRRHFADLLTREVPCYPLRFAATPGLTGWDQVNNGYPGTLKEQVRKFHYDLDYLRQASFWLDLKILARTLLVLLTRRGR